MIKDLKKKCYEIMISKPTSTDADIATTLNISTATVWRVRKSLLGGIDYALARKVAGAFLVEFQQASDFFKLQVERLENLKTKKKIIFKKNKNGELKEYYVELDPLDMLMIEKHQTELWKNIIFFARQGEAIEIMRLMKNGKLSVDN